MRILYSTLGYPPHDTSGAEAIGQEITQRLADNDIETHVLVPSYRSAVVRKKRRLYIHWLKVRELKTLPLGPFSIPLRQLSLWLELKREAKNLINEYDINLVHSMDYAGYYIAGKIPTIAYSMHPTIYDYVYSHSPTQRLYVLFFTSNMERRVIKQSIRVICDSYNTQRLLGNLYPFAKRKMVVVHLGIDAEKFTFSPCEGSAIREKYGISPEDILILHPGGGRSERKGTLLLLEALAKIQKNHIKCMITGSTREAGWRHRLIKKLREKQLTNVTLTGELNYNQMPSYYSAADIVVFPSLFEGHPLPPMEALACEKALICTDVSDHRMLYKDNEDALLVKTGDVKALKFSIERLVDDHELRTRLGKNGRKLIEEKLSIENTVERLIEIYNTISND